MTTEEGNFQTRDGTRLYTKTWKPSTQSPFHLIFLHGFSDHINAYYTLFPTLSTTPYNITIHGFDQRGWGRSVPQNSKSSRGLTGDTTLVLSDIHDFILHVSQQLTTITTSTNPPPKLFLMGHSMGGAESLYYALSKPPLTPPLPIPITGILVESPHISLPASAQPSSLLVVSGRFAAKFLPNKQMLQKLDSSAMSRNPQVCKDWDDDPLCHDTGTLRGLAGLLDRAGHLDTIGLGKSVPGLSGKLDVPVFWAHGDQDKVVDFTSSKRLFERVGRADQTSLLREYTGGFHKLHAEPDGMGEEFASDVGGWVLRIGGVGGGATAGGDGMIPGETKQPQQHEGQDPASTGTAVANDTVSEGSDGKTKSRL